MRAALMAVCLSLAAAAAFGQGRVIRATGTASVSVKPDQVKIDIGVSTKASTAQDAAAQNASATDKLLTQLKSALAGTGDIQTINYSIVANYQYPQNAPPVLLGYTASNTVRVTMNELSKAGAVIDAGTQAGATSIGGLRFGLKDDEPARAQALGAAAKQAKAHADAIASGLGLHTGMVRTAQEGASVTPLPVNTVGVTATQTPIETGFVEVQATVTLDVELTS